MQKMYNNTIAERFVTALILSLVLAFTSFSSANAQVNYTRTTLTGQTYTTLSGAGITTINTDAGLTSGVMSASQDDGAAIITLPFTMRYNGNSYTTVTMCTNGWLGFGSQTAVTASNSRAPGNLFNTTEPFNLVAAWWRDMGANWPTGAGSFRHGLTGTDTYTFQWDKACGTGFSDGTTTVVS